jgi:hypothetical protein
MLATPPPERCLKRVARGSSTVRLLTASPTVASEPDAAYAARMLAENTEATADPDTFTPPLRVRGVRGAPIESLGD